MLEQVQMAAPVGPKKVHRYTVEFKIQAVKLARHPEIQTQGVAHALDLGVLVMNTRTIVTLNHAIDRGHRAMHEKVRVAGEELRTTCVF